MLLGMGGITASDVALEKNVVKNQGKGVEKLGFGVHVYMYGMVVMISSKKIVPVQYN